MNDIHLIDELLSEDASLIWILSHRDFLTVR
jgi:hypothetical protein